MNVRTALNVARTVTLVWVIVNGYFVWRDGPRSAAANLFAAIFGFMVLVWSFWPRRRDRS